MKKKILALILSLIIILPCFIVPVSAAGNPYQVVPATTYDEDLSYTNGTFEIYPNRIGSVAANCYLAFPDMDFGSKPPTHVEIEAGSREPYADVVVMRLDDPKKGQIVAEIPFERVNFSVPSKSRIPLDVEITGKHTVYVTTKSSTMNFYNFRFIVPQEKVSGYETYQPGGRFSGLEAGSVATAADLLWQLGILPEEAGTELNADTPISRGWFANAIYAIYNDRAPGKVTVPEGASYETGFSDVASDSQYAQAVAFLAQYDVIKGNGEGMFLPHHYIKTIDAVAILLRLLGYNDMIAASGGYPVGYAKVGRQVGILPDGDTNDAMRLGEAVLLLNDTLKANYLSVSGLYIPNVIRYENVKGILGMYRGLARGEGKVTASPISGLTIPETGLPVNKVQIDNTIYNMGTTDAMSLLGYECEFFYKEDNGVRTLYAIAPSSYVEMQAFSSATDEIVSISNSELAYVPQGETEEEIIKLSGETYIFYNGVAIEGRLTEAVQHENNFTGSFVVAENSDGSKAVYVDEYEDYIVESIGLDGLSFVGADGAGTVSWTNNDLFYLQDPDGMSLTMTDLSAGNLVTAYVSGNTSGRKLIRLFTCEAEVEGTVTTIGSDGTYIDGKKYTISNNMATTLTVGKEGVFLLNIYGDVVAIADQSSATWQLGLLMDTYDGGTGLDKVPKVKILTLDPKEQEYDVASTLTADGIRVKNATDIAYGILTTSGRWVGLENIAAETAVRYRLDSEGKISGIDTPNPGAGGTGDTLSCLLNCDSSLTLMYYPSTGLVHSQTDKLGLFFLPPETKIMGFYGDTDHSAENCVVDAAKTIIYKTDFKPYGGFYSTTGERNKADFFVWSNVTATMEAVGQFVYKSTSRGVDEDGNSVTLLTGWGGGKESTYIYDKTKQDLDADSIPVLDNLRVGDVINITVFPGTKVIQKAELWCLANGAESRTVGSTTLTPKLSTTTRTNDATTATNRGIFGRLVEKGDGYATVQIGTDAVTGEPIIETIITGSASICKVATSETKPDNIVQSAKLDNLAVTDIVFAHIRSGACQTIIIFDDALL